MTTSKPHVSVVILAAGMGKRMNTKTNKQFLILKDKPIISHTIEPFETHNLIDEIILVVREDEIEYTISEIVSKYGFKKVKRVVKGGVERQESSYEGLKNCSSETDIVLIHDGVRPFINESDIDSLIAETILRDACVIGVPVKDTVKVVDMEQIIVDTPNRDSLWLVHTPQAFKYHLVLDAHKRAREENSTATDDSSLVEKLGIEVKMIMGSYDNIKITTPEDLFVAENILNRR